jgi:CHAT domain-containing protein/Tfp pilus assembly protein PilF
MRTRIALTIVALLVVWSSSAAQEKTPEERQLARGQTVEQGIAGGETHSYSITLQRGQFLRAVVNSLDIDVVALLYGPGGEKLLTVDLLNYAGPGPLSLVAEKAGEYRLEIRSDAPATSSGHYELSSKLKPAVETEDMERLRAERLLTEANNLVHDGSKESLPKSINKCTEALSLWRKLRDPYWEAYAVNNIGSTYSNLGEPRKALDYLNQALALRRTAGDRRGEAETLNNIGSVYSNLGEKSKALEHYDQALTLTRAVGDHRGEAETLDNIGQAYWSLGENQKALTFYNQALPLMRSVGDRKGEADTLNNIGVVCDDLGEKQRALDYYNQALPLRRSVSDRSGEAVTLNNLGASYANLGEMQKALDYFNRALSLERAVGDRQAEAGTLNNIGFIYSALGEKQKALDYYNQALPLKRAVGDRGGEAGTLNNIGFVYDSLGEKQKALDYYNQALPLKRAVGDRGGEAYTLHNIGHVYSSLGEMQKALDYYNQALPLERAVGDRRGEAGTLNNVGAVYDLLGEKQKALDYYNLALPLKRTVGDRAGEAETLNGIGSIYNSLGEKQKALDYYNQALPLRRAVGDRRGEADTLNNIGDVYNRLVDKQRALDYYNQALPLRHAVGDRAGEAGTLIGIGSVYEDRGENQRALDYYNQALLLERAIGARGSEARTLSYLGNLYYTLGEKQKALDYDNQALLLERAVGDRAGEAVTLASMGLVYYTLSEKEKALDYYNQALPLERAVGDRADEAVTLGNFMSVWRELNRPALAIFYGKQAINILQQLRANIKGLEKGLQQSFLHSKEDTYRTLADILISQGRIPEAQQVLGLLKEQELNDFIQRDAGPGARAEENDKEAEWEKRYGEVADRVAAIGKEYGELLDKLKVAKELPPEEKNRMDQLRVDLDVTRKEFLKVVDQIYVEFGKGEQGNAKRTDIKEYQTIRNALNNLGPGVVALYTIVEDDKYRVLLYLRDTEIPREYKIKREELNDLVFKFREIFDEPPTKNVEKDPRPLAQKLYQIVIGPIAKDLEQAKAQTLMWSLDGVLRYVPIAALYDGQQYMVERYRNVVITKGSLVNIEKTPASSDWKGLGLGVSLRFESFKPLTFVPDELRNVIREQRPAASTTGIIPGDVMLDDKFNAKTMKDALLPESYQVVHIASHFKFGPSQKTSFLLLGDGQHFTLEELEGGGQRLFNGVDLLTLSACETAVGGAEVNGKEVESFGAIAQQLGAKAVIASLWPVADKSTPILMKEFYAAKKADPTMSKAEALQKAQLKLLRSEEYSHPYFWAPFILIGNWR